MKPGRPALCLALLVATVPLRAQTDRTDEAAARMPALAFGFERNVNTFLWDLRGYHALGGEGWSASASERFQRSLIRSERESIKDENAFELRAARRLAASVSLVSRFSSFTFTDSKISGLNDIANHTLLGGVEAQPWPFLTLTPLAGYAFDTQQGTHDHGFSYLAGADLRGLRFGESELTGQASFAGMSIAPRNQQEHRIDGLLFSVFTPGSTNRLNVFYRSLRRDFYLELDTAATAFTGAVRDIETRREQSIGGGDALIYALGDHIAIDASVDLVQRRIAKSRGIRALSAGSQLFDSNIDEFRLNGSASVRYRAASTDARALVELNERSETHGVERFPGSNSTLFSQQERLEEQKNNSITQTRLAFSVRQAIARSDTLTVSGSSVKTVYNTPSALNYDDRDELFLLASARWSHRLSGSLLAYLAADINLRHTVYISSERSANNTWNRVIRLSPGAEFRLGDRVTSLNSADVIANYTVYDFEESNPAQRSFSLRQLILADSTTISLHRDLTLTLQLQLRISERGEFRWDAFTVRPISWHDERSMTVLFTHPSRSAVVSAGFRLFELIRYRYSGGGRVRENTLRSYGPVCRIRCSILGQSSLVADGWYQITSENPGDTRSTPNISLGAVWNL